MSKLITVVASGTRGDVQPYVALGQGLQRAGFAVRLVSSDDFAELGKSAGLDFRSTGIGVESLLQSEEWRSTIERGNFIAILRRMRTAMQQHAQKLALNLPDQLAGSELILAGVAGLGGAFSYAQKYAIPLLQAYLLPLSPTAVFASPLPLPLPPGAKSNRLSFLLLRQALWQSVRSSDLATRRVLALPSGSFWGPYRELERRVAPLLYGFSEHILPRPADWNRSNNVTGYWFLDPPSEWQPPAGLVEFLAAGPPPVYIGFGSMGSRNPAELTSLALAALQQTGQRGVLASGWGGLADIDLPPGVYAAPALPHSWLFPRMAAVVHHGGAGTTAAGLSAGIPSIIVPFFGDQPFWGRRVAALGVGPAPIPRRQLTATRLAGAISQALTDGALRQRAARLGAQISAEDGVERAVELVRRFVERPLHRGINWRTSRGV